MNLKQYISKAGTSSGAGFGARYEEISANSDTIFLGSGTGREKQRASQDLSAICDTCDIPCPEPLSINFTLDEVDEWRGFSRRLRECARNNDEKSARNIFTPPIPSK